jgi:hypothetical protein
MELYDFGRNRRVYLQRKKISIPFSFSIPSYLSKTRSFWIPHEGDIGNNTSKEGGDKGSLIGQIRRHGTWMDCVDVNIFEPFHIQSLLQFARKQNIA